ncbi:MAG: riboflavin deaminase [Desertifilum sp. SIO1I2]|nr:riboflavin deaminase [Desertifilum sp. SIO1I2]
MGNPLLSRPHTTVILALSADGKIANSQRQAARFGSAQDRAHLEAEVAKVDGVLLGAGTLRAYGTTMRVMNPQPIQQREALGKPPQPVQIVVSRQAKIDPNLRFFQQPVPRWLLTTSEGAKSWQNSSHFESIQVYETATGEIDWPQALAQMPFERLAVLGGGELVASLLAEDLIDELRLTVCPVLLGGRDAPTPVSGVGLPAGKGLELISVEAIAHEVFLHYRVVGTLQD